MYSLIGKIILMQVTHFFFFISCKKLAIHFTCVLRRFQNCAWWCTVSVRARVVKLHGITKYRFYTKDSCMYVPHLMYIVCQLYAYIPHLMYMCVHTCTRSIFTISTTRQSLLGDQNTLQVPTECFPVHLHFSRNSHHLNSALSGVSQSFHVLLPCG
jgi:hypothetical protein